MKFVLFISMMFVSNNALAAYGVMVRFGADLCKAEYETWQNCVSKKQGSCNAQVDNYNQCLKTLPAAIAPIVAPYGLKIDPDYSVWIGNHVYVVRGALGDISIQNWNSIIEALGSAGFSDVALFGDGKGDGF